MKALIIETLKKPADSLQERIHSVDDHVEILSCLSSLEESVRYFRTNPQPDLLFFEPAPGNGLSFQLFDQTAVVCPVVYILDPDLPQTHLFLPNCMDVLSKPPDPFQLKKCIQHYRELQDFFIKNHSSLFEHFNGNEKLKSRILIKKGNEYQTFRVSEVVYFFSDHKLVFLVDRENRKYLTAAGSLSELLNQLDGQVFYRANRKYIVNVNHIQVFSMANSSRISLKLSLPLNEPILISQQNTAFFKLWIGEKL
ncbi:MAG: LytR/AlgR family response regulator transcription factor [Chitinophagales bacterium]